MSEEKEYNIINCPEECSHDEIQNGECKCWNRYLDEREEQSPC